MEHCPLEPNTSLNTDKTPPVWSGIKSLGAHKTCILSTNIGTPMEMPRTWLMQTWQMTGKIKECFLVACSRSRRANLKKSASWSRCCRRVCASLRKGRKLSLKQIVASQNGKRVYPALVNCSVIKCKKQVTSKIWCQAMGHSRQEDYREALELAHLHALCANHASFEI